MEKCALCGGKLVKDFEKRDNVNLEGMRCTKCNELFVPTSEIFRWEVLAGRRKLSRKVGIIGDSFAVRIPKKIVEQNKIKPGDHAVFEQAKDGILIKIIH